MTSPRDSRKGVYFPRLFIFVVGSIFKRLTTLVKEALIEIGCVVTSLVVGRWSVVGWLVVTRVHCGQTVHPRPIVTMEH